MGALFVLFVFGVIVWMFNCTDWLDEFDFDE